MELELVAEPIEEIVGDWVIDLSTGEILRHVQACDEFHVEDMASAEWVLERMAEVDGDILGLEARLAAITDQMGAMVRDRKNRREWLDRRFGAELEHFAAGELLGAKTRTLKTPYGSLSFRTSPGSIKVVNEEGALEWAKAHCPEAVKVKESVLVTPLKGQEEMLPVAFFEVEGPKDRFYVKTGVDNRKGATA